MTFAPNRRAMYAIRSPKKPHMQTATASPGSRRLASPASIPAEPVPESAIVAASSVWNSVLRLPATSSRTGM